MTSHRDEAIDVAAAFGAKQCVVCRRLCTGVNWLFRHVPQGFPGAFSSADGVRWLACVCSDVDDSDDNCAGRLQLQLVEHGR